MDKARNENPVSVNPAGGGSFTSAERVDSSASFLEAFDDGPALESVGTARDTEEEEEEEDELLLVDVEGLGSSSVAIARIGGESVQSTSTQVLDEVLLVLMPQQQQQEPWRKKPLSFHNFP